MFDAQEPIAYPVCDGEGFAIKAVFRPNAIFKEPYDESWCHSKFVPVQDKSARISFKVANEKCEEKTIVELDLKFSKVGEDFCLLQCFRLSTNDDRERARECSMIHEYNSAHSDCKIDELVVVPPELQSFIVEITCLPRDTSSQNVSLPVAMFVPFPIHDSSSQYSCKITVPNRNMSTIATADKAHLVGYLAQYLVAARSDVFAAMLNSPMLEGQKQEIMLSEPFSELEFKDFCEYLQYGELKDNKDPETYTLLLGVACKYLMEDLVKRCIARILEAFTVNVLDTSDLKPYLLSTISLAHGHNLPVLKGFFKSLLFLHRRSLLQDAEFLAAMHRLNREILAEVQCALAGLLHYDPPALPPPPHSNEEDKEDGEKKGTEGEDESNEIADSKKRKTDQW